MKSLRSLYSLYCQNNIYISFEMLDQKALEDFSDMTHK